jgi:hypothetical protein
MSLPKIQSSYAKQYQSVLRPQIHLNDATFNDTIILNISTGKNLVMSGINSVLKLDYVIKASAAGNVVSDIDKYAALMMIIFAVTQSSDALVSNYRNSGVTDYAAGASFILKTLTAYIEFTYSYCIPLMRILLLTQNYIPSSKMKNT